MLTDRRQCWRIAACVFLCWALAASMLAVYYQRQYAQTLQRFESTTIRIYVIFDYGNGSTYRRQHRDTLALAGESLLLVTIRLAKVKYDTYAIGVLVVSIDGIENTKTKAWLWYHWDDQSKSWLLGETGPDRFIPRNGQVLIWYYTSFESWPPSPPDPPSMAMHEGCFQGCCGK